MIWKILGIEKTKDEEAIKTAYRRKLRDVNPEDDQEGFKELRRAYEEALEYANTTESDLHGAENGEQGFEDAKKDDIDLWLDRVDAIYQDARTRRDEDKWKAVLNDPVCEDLDMELEAAEKLLVYFMSHSFMPQAIWQLVDKRFRYIDNYNQLKEKFPENYLDYVKWQIEHSNFIDFNLFDGKTDSHVDDYINTLYEEKSAYDDNDMDNAQRLLKELSRYDITHPFTKVEEARYLLKRQQEEGGEYAKEALSIMEELDFEYSENPYIERIYAETLMENGEIEKAKTIFDELLEESSDNYGAMLGQAKCIFLAGNAEEAKERVEDILEERVQDAESLKLLDVINEKLIKDYEASLEQETDRELCFKLGWCYYQQKEFEKGIALLDQLEPGEDYDYINLRGRLYLANEDYDKAYPITKKWLELIENCEDDGSKEMQKRKNRLSLAYFSIGICMWETEYQKKKENKSSGQEDVFEEAASYIRKGIEEEKNILVRLSYMEQLARFYLEEEKYTECIDICNEIIEQDRGFFPAYVHRQRANYKLKNAKEVVDDYFACQEIYPGYSKPYVLAAEVFFAFDQYDDVENVIKAGREAGLDSDGLELYRIKCLHYKEFSEKNLKKALDAILALKEKINNRPKEEETDIEDLAEVEKEQAIIYWDMDKTDMALGIIDDYLENNPEETTLLHLKIDILNRENRFDEALEVAREWIKLEPHNLFARTKLGNCYERMEDMDKAIECYRMILVTDKDYGPAIRRLMYIYSYLSDQEDDLEKCKAGIKYATRLIEATGSAEGYVERGNLNIDLYELEQAVEDCKAAIRLDPEAYYAYNNLGCALLKLRRVDEAIEPLEQAIHMEPDKDHLPYLNLAECYALKKEYEKAIHAYKEVLRLRPNAYGMKEQIAKLYIKMKDFNEAVWIYQELINSVKMQAGDDSQDAALSRKLKKNSDERKRILSYYCDIADIYRQAGDYKKAEKYYKKVVSEFCSPFAEYPPSRMEDVAEYYRDKGELAEAEKILKKALKKVNPDRYSTAHISFTYATVLFELGRRKEAAVHANIFINDLLNRNGGEEKMLADRRYRPMYLYDLGIMKICAGQFAEGKAYLERIRECNLCVTCKTCDCFEYYFGMGLLAELNNRREEAKELYEKAIAIEGDYPCCERHLKKL